jgi:hypothetical protein
VTTKVTKQCDICGEEHSYEIDNKPNLIPDWMIPDWMIPGWYKNMKKEYYSKVQLHVYNGEDKWILGYTECCSECTKVLQAVWADAIKFLKSERPC